MQNDDKDADLIGGKSDEQTVMGRSSVPRLAMSKQHIPVVLAFRANEYGYSCRAGFHGW